MAIAAVLEITYIKYRNLVIRYSHIEYYISKSAI